MRLNGAEADRPEVSHATASCMQAEQTGVEGGSKEGKGSLLVPSLPSFCQAFIRSAYHVKSQTGSGRELTCVAAHL